MRLAYIIACYFGPRRSAPQCYFDRPLSFVERHLARLAELDHSVTSVIFVLNLEPHHREIAAAAQDAILSHFNEDPKLRTMDASVLTRPNVDYSYGAWNHALSERCGQFDYALLLEDDYVPSTHQFDSKFMEFFTDDQVCYVCGLFRDCHPAVSWGLLRSSVYDDLFHRGKPFDLARVYAHGFDGYDHAERLQCSFMLPYLHDGYRIVDVTSKYRVPFYNYQGQTIIYGKHDAEALISPVCHIGGHFVGGIHFKEMIEEDIPFFNALRSECIERLHCQKRFSNEEAIRWFRTTKPCYYIIYVDGRKAGYFRTSQYSEQNRSMYVGSDLLPEYRGQGVGYAAYNQFLPFLFETFDLNKISLEVLSTNQQAIALYKKLGFVVEGVKREDILSNGIFVDSIIMSMLRSECYGAP